MARPRKDPEELVQRGIRLASEAERPISLSRTISGCILRRCASVCTRRRPIAACGRTCRAVRSGRRSSGCAGRTSSCAVRNEILKAASVFLRPSSTQPDRSERIEQPRERFGVEPICRTLGVSASAY